jgi:uncharacterized protein
MMNETCEVPLENAGAPEIDEILRTARTIAVVGLSDNPERDSHRVARYLRDRGYRILPVNPNAAEILGAKCYATLREIGEPVDIVDVFRKPEAVPEIVADAIAIGARAVWLQSGIAHNAAAGQARAAGLKVVQSRCLMVEHRNRQAAA